MASFPPQTNMAIGKQGIEEQAAAQLMNFWYQLVNCVFLKIHEFKCIMLAVVTDWWQTVQGVLVG